MSENRREQSWLTEEIEGVDEIYQIYSEVFGESDNNQSYSVEDWQEKTGQFKERAEQWHKKHLK